MPGELMMADRVDEPSLTHPAWIAMPVAKPLLDQVPCELGLDWVVSSIWIVASTLVALHAQGTFHWDLKPTNLFFYEDQPTIGDFGQVNDPDSARHMLSGKRLGPLGFVADEMRSMPEKAKGAAVDVYALAKTLWIYATGQHYPPQGQIRGVDRDRLGQYIDDPRPPQLDGLIERATSREPAERPSMLEFSRELMAWENSATAGKEGLSDNSSGAG